MQSEVSGVLGDLITEAERQLKICNACRYCEGYCAVFPALERRIEFSDGDIMHLANLCHDCRACLHACMYAHPHEFELNPPKVLAEIRLHTYDGTVTAPKPARFTGRSAVAMAFLVSLGYVVVLAAASEGVGALWRTHSGASSPYRVISYPVLVVAMAIPFLVAVAGAIRAGARYWRRTRGPLADLGNLGAWRGALADAARLRYLRGGGAECEYPQETPSPLRRRYHGLVAYGFLACAMSTVSAAIEQDVLGIHPPYRWLSVPVLSGMIGGVAMIAGCVGLIALKARTRPAETSQRMRARDFNLLSALLILAATGVATVLTRTTTVYGVVLAVHLAAVTLAFVIAPYTKFCHFLYRLLALVQDHLEREVSARSADGA